MVKTLVLVLAAIASSPAFGTNRSVAYTKVKAAGLVAHVVTVDLVDPALRVSVALAKGGTGHEEAFKSIVKRASPHTAVTGTFFDTRTLQPTGDIALFGKLVHSGCVGSAICIDRQNRASIVTLREGRKNGWDGYETVLCAGPRLVTNGKVAIATKHEGFRRSLHASNRRVAVGISARGKLLLVIVNRPAGLYALAKLIVKAGGIEAVALDGGSSTAFYHAGRFLAVPARKLTNCLVVYRSISDYENAREALAPSQVVSRVDSPSPRNPAFLPMLGLLIPRDMLFPPTVGQLP